MFTGVTTVGSGSSSSDSGWANKRIKIKMPTSITNFFHKVFTNCNFYAQDQLVISAGNVASGYGFQNVTTLTDIIFTAEVFSAFSGYFIYQGTSANIVFQNATAVPPAVSNMGTPTGSIYVPDALVDSWKAASNWSRLAAKIKPLSQWPNLV